MKKYRSYILLLFLAFQVIGGCSSNTDKKDSSLEAVMDPQPTDNDKEDISDIRREMLLEAGKTAGFRAAMIARAKAINERLEIRSQQLDTIFQFTPLVSKKGVLPPVIVEAQDVASFQNDQIRTSDKVYNIKTPERFISVPPTWRDYLYTGLPIQSKQQVSELPTLPTGKAEKSIWREAVQAGWNEGIKSSDAILEANFNRLARDYTGMMRYSILLQKNMISSSVVTEKAQVVSGSDNDLMIGNKHKVLVNKSKFKLDADNWSSTLTTKQGIFPPIDTYHFNHKATDKPLFKLEKQEINYPVKKVNNKK